MTTLNASRFVIDTSLVVVVPAREIRGTVNRAEKNLARFERRK